MAKFKNVAIFVLSALMFLGICVMAAGCSDSDKITKLQQQIAELENKLDEQEDKNDELNRKINGWQSVFDEQGDRIDELKKENENLSDRIKDLIDHTSLSGFFTLTKAYSYGLLSKDDLMSIAFYKNRGTRLNEEIMGEDYTPSPKNPEVLSEETDIAIRQDYLDRYLKNKEDVTLDDISISSYYGTYNNCVAVMVQYGCYTTAFWQETAGGVKIEYGSGNRILLWVNNKKGEDGESSSRDDDILRYYREPTIDEPFEDNKVDIILKSAYDELREISFDAFKIVEQVCGINSIKYGLRQYTREGAGIIFLDDDKNHMFTLELAVNDKQTVLDVISQLQTLDMVLVAEPSYIYDVVFFNSND